MGNSSTSTNPGGLTSSIAISTTTSYPTSSHDGDKKDEYQFTITQLEDLDSFLQLFSFGSTSHNIGYYLLGLLVLVVSGMLSLNSGLCWKIKSCRNFLEVSYTCSDNDSLSVKNFLCIRAFIITFNCSYASTEVLISGLLAVYVTSLPGISIFMGIAAMCLFWSCFLCGRIVFIFLSPLSRMFRLTLLTNSLTILCLVALYSAPYLTSSLPWYFFACMISLISFFFSLVGPSFSGYRENFPLLAYSPPFQKIITSCGEAILPAVSCSLVFAGRTPQLPTVLIVLSAVCLLSAFVFKYLASSAPRKLKTPRRKPSFNSESWAENVEDADGLTSSLDGSSTTKPLLP